MRLVAAAREYNASLPAPATPAPTSTRAAPPRAGGAALSFSVAF